MTLTVNCTHFVSGLPEHLLLRCAHSPADGADFPMIFARNLRTLDLRDTSLGEVFPVDLNMPHLTDLKFSPQVLHSPAFRRLTRGEGLQLHRSQVGCIGIRDKRGKGRSVCAGS